MPIASSCVATNRYGAPGRPSRTRGHPLLPGRSPEITPSGRVRLQTMRQNGRRGAMRGQQTRLPGPCRATPDMAVESSGPVDRRAAHTDPTSPQPDDGLNKGHKRRARLRDDHRQGGDHQGVSEPLRRLLTRPPTRGGRIRQNDRPDSSEYAARLGCAHNPKVGSPLASFSTSSRHSAGIRGRRDRGGNRRRPSGHGPGRGASQGSWAAAPGAGAPADSLRPSAARIMRSAVRQRGRGAVRRRTSSSWRRMRSSRSRSGVGRLRRMRRSIRRRRAA